MKQKDLRYERKIYYPYSSKYELEYLVKSHLYGFKEIYYERQVNSLYFDSEEYCSFRDNADGNPNRAKVRIRWYGDNITYNLNDSLEIKTKKGFIGYKIKEAIENMGDKKVGVCPNDLKPVLKVSYDRMYFSSFDKKFRFTIDSDVRYSNPDNSVEYKDSGCVLELKYNVENEDTAYIITNKLTYRVGKHSKYARGILFLYG